MRLSLICRKCSKWAPSTLKALLITLHEAGAHCLRVVCWHSTHVLLNAGTQLLQATGLVTVSSGLLTVLSSTR